MPFSFQKLRIPDVLLVKPNVFTDGRGFFAEVFKAEVFSASGIQGPFVQMNHSRSGKSVLRGLHYQKTPKAQAKLIRVLKGEIYDVAVDMRQGSPFFGQWIAEILSEDNFNMLYVPEGFAHGFLTLSDHADLEYLCTCAYSPSDERGVRYDDPSLAIDWPEENPLLSQRDLNLPLLKDADNNFVYEK